MSAAFGLGCALQCNIWSSYYLKEGVMEPGANY